MVPLDSRFRHLDTAILSAVLDVALCLTFMCSSFVLPSDPCVPQDRPFAPYVEPNFFENRDAAAVYLM